MLMLSLNNKYFIGSVYTGMLWSLDVTKPFPVNFFDVQKNNLYRFHAGGSGIKHECRGRERDQIKYISAGTGGRGTESCSRSLLRCKISVPHINLEQRTYRRRFKTKLLNLSAKSNKSHNGIEDIQCLALKTRRNS